MPSLATTQPNYPRRLDLRDSVDPVDRQLESITASLSLAVGASAGIKNPLPGAPGTGVDSQAGKYFMPGTIPASTSSTTGRSGYETAVDSLVTNINAALVNLATIQALKPSPNLG